MTGKITGPLREQSDWTQNDEHRLGFIKNKPFYDTRKAEPLTIEWDGEIGGRETTSFMFEPFVKLSEATPTYEEIVQAIIHFNIESGAEFAFMDAREEGMPFAAYCNTEGMPLCLFIFDNFEMEGVAFSKGIYSLYKETDLGKIYVEYLHLPSVTTGELKTIDPKFLPDNRVIYYTTPDSENNGVLYRTSEKVDENMVTGEELKEAFENGKDIWVSVDFMGTSIYLYANSVAFAHDTDAGVLDGMVGCTMLPVGGQVIQYLFTTFNS